MADVSIADALARLGLTGPDAERARGVLEEASLTNPRKERIAAGKLERVRAAVDARFARLCRECAGSAAPDGREPVVVPAAACASCGGSANDRALRELVERCRVRGVRRLVVVGGSPSLRTDFARVGDELELRLVDGTERRTGATAKADVEWADVVVVCGASELDHKVSRLYTREPAAKGKLAIASRRGLAAIAGAAVEHLSRRPSR